MNSYSNIKSIYYKNFRNIGEVKIDFNDSPIIALVGDNESGKTSVIKGFAVCALHAWARDQKDFIRQGTDSFEVAIELFDGTIIKRVKTQAVNKYDIKYADGSVWSTNKIDAGLPVQVKELMGLVEEPETKEFLHIRTYEDQLLFVTTSASTNYKVMYDALKVDQLTRAIKAGNTEVNELKRKIDTDESSISAFKGALKNIKIYNLEPLVNIKKRVEIQLAVLDKLEKALDIKAKIKKIEEQLEVYSRIAKQSLVEIDMVEFSRLISINRILNSISKLTNIISINNKLSALDYIDLTLVNKIESAIEKHKILRAKIKDAFLLLKLKEFDEINEYEVQLLGRLMNLADKIKRSNNLLRIIDRDGLELIKQSDFNVANSIYWMISIRQKNELLETEINKLLDDIKKIENYLKHLGVAVIRCTNCGNDMVIGINDNQPLHPRLG